MTAAIEHTLISAEIHTPLGTMLAIASDPGLCLLEFTDRRAIGAQLAALRRQTGADIKPGRHRHLDQVEHELSRYFAGEALTFGVPLSDPGTPFQRVVWAALRQIPAGHTRTYAQLACDLRRPTAARAVAGAIADNRLAIVIPCHRVIGSNGSPTGYSGGIWRKQRLLEHESATITRAKRPAAFTLR